MDCYQCEKAFDRGEHLPKNLSCGHTFCLKCLSSPQYKKICFVCTKRYLKKPEELPNNHQLLLLCANPALAAGLLAQGRPAVTQGQQADGGEAKPAVSQGQKADGAEAKPAVGEDETIGPPPDLSAPAAQCSLTLGPGAEAWRPSLPPDDVLARLVLYRLLCNGAFVKVEPKETAEERDDAGEKDKEPGEEREESEAKETGEETRKRDTEKETALDGTDKVAEEKDSNIEAGGKDTEENSEKDPKGKEGVQEDGEESKQKRSSPEEDELRKEEGRKRKALGDEKDASDEKNKKSMRLEGEDEEGSDGEDPAEGEDDPGEEAAWTADGPNEAAAPLPYEEMAVRTRVGSTVVPGRDWQRGWQRGRRALRGTVVRLQSGRAWVKWSCGAKDGAKDGAKGVAADGAKGVANARAEPDGYEMGANGLYCLRLVPGYLSELVKRDVVALIESDCAKTLLEVSQGDDIKKKTEMLTSAELKGVRSLVGLSCAVSPAWAERVLEQTSPRLESLLALGLGERHAAVLRDMPRLRRLWLPRAPGALPDKLRELHVKLVSAEQLVQIAQMSGLRRLEVHCRSAAPLELPARGWPPAAPAGGGGLRWLCAGLHPLAAALALVRAHGRTLRELRLVAASDRPYGGASPDLTAALRPLCRRLRRLRRLVLVRESYSGFCRHDVDTCGQQRRGLWDLFMEERVFSSVLCSLCDSSDV